jgi:hypothetical protein
MHPLSSLSFLLGVYLKPNNKKLVKIYFLLFKIILLCIFKSLLMLNFFLKNKKYYFDVFLSKKQQLLHFQIALH